ncbi:galactose mutarotase [Bacteroidales bacterium OttesenSCG-928-J19]|nr:galactose mutarotase [Bacteroidales bacterium OttesenSCG-928-J19]
MKHSALTLLAICLLFFSCKEDKSVLTDSGLHPSQFALIDNGKASKLYVLKNDNGMEVCVTNIGMRIVSIMVPDKDGAMKDVVLGFDKLDPYKDATNYFGATVGRYANRIAEGKFVLDRVTYNLSKAAGEQDALHGGPRGFQTQYFQIEQVGTTELRGKYISKNKEEGYPGDMSITVIYHLTKDNALDIQYEAQTNMATVINVTNHSYFNLSGDLSKDILDHQLFIDADNYTPTNEALIPTGKIEPVKGTALDFTQATAIGARINDESNAAIKLSKGYDINYVLNHADSLQYMAAKLYSPASGITMEVYTTEPGLQLYTANELNVVGKGGKTYGNYSAVCLETQHFPDSPNQPDFPSTVLRPSDMFFSQTTYKFGVEK